MLKRFARSIAIVGALIITGSAAQAQNYTFQYFSDPSPNAFYTIGTDLSPTGELVGWYSNEGSGVWGFSETDGTYQTISVPTTGSPYTVINAISDGGELVGYTGSNGFVMDSSGHLTTIAVPTSFEATSISMPASINSSGTIVGNFSTVSGAQEGFILENGTYKTYQVPGSYSTTLSDINDDGVIVGSYQTSLLGNPISFKLSNGTLTEIQFPGAGVIYTVATGINAAGNVVGVYYTSDNGFPFYFDGAAYTQIASPGAEGCYPSHIKNSGDIVGTCTNPSTKQEEAFIGTPTS